MKWLLYFNYLLLLSTQVFVACFCANQKCWNGWRRWGKTIFFGMGALTSISLAKTVFTKDNLVIDLTDGVFIWSSLPRALALTAVCYGLWIARKRHEEDIVL